MSIGWVKLRDYQNVLLKIIEISERMRSNLNLEDLVDYICMSVVNDLEWQQAIIVLRDEDTKTSRPHAARGMPDHIRKKILASPPSTWTEWYKIPEFKVSNSFFVRNLSAHMDIVPKEIQDRMLMGADYQHEVSKWNGDDFLMVPIRSKSQWVGILNVDNPASGQAPTVDDIRMLELFANQVSIAIQNAKAFEQQKNFSERLAIEIERKTKQLEEQNLELQTYISSLTHDLKTPLVSINALIGILKEDAGPELSEDTLYLIDRITRNADRMSKILSDLVSYYNVQKTSDKKEHIHIADLIRDEYQRVSDTFPGKDVELIIEGEFPVMYQSKLVLSIIFSNLISNAIKFSTNINSFIKVTYERKDSDHVFYVADNGIGFDMKYADKIFLLFERLSKKQAEGTGIGLATVKKMLDKIGGTITVDSTEGQGTIFTVKIPSNIY
jgi:signal transduction histidine kinase